MFMNKVLLLTLAMIALATGSTRNVVKKRHLARSKKPSLLVKRMKGENGEPDEVEIDTRMFTCKKGSDECKKQLKGKEEVSKKEFAKNLADGMLGKLEEDEDDRKLGWYDSYACDRWNCYWTSW